MGWLGAAVVLWHCAGDTADPRAPAMGARLRLKAGYGLGRFRGAARVVAVALKRYGLIVADNGSNWFFGRTSDRRWDDETSTRPRLRGRQERRHRSYLLTPAVRSGALYAPIAHIRRTGSYFASRTCRNSARRRERSSAAACSAPAGPFASSAPPLTSA